MPTLLDANQVLATGAEAAPDTVPADAWQPGSEQVPVLGAGDEIDTAVLAAPRIAIDFPAFNDGRGLSLAVLLRSRHGYEGELLAVGDVHEDILHYMHRCGFDTYVLPDDRNADTALAALAPYSDHYQASVAEPQPAFRRVSRGAHQP